ncbi:MAG: peptidoglycan-binding protein [Bacillota bacterium]|nr:peptidoglycan-binding protein [Bacillota bacterium]
MKHLLLIILLSFSFILSPLNLANAENPGCPDVHRDLFLTSPLLKGEDITELQHRLRELGYNPGQADGIFGPLTEAAVVGFQRNQGLDAPKGLVNLEFWNSLAEGVTIDTSVEKLEKPEGFVSIIIDADKKTLTVYDDDKVHVVLPVAVGKFKTPTPIGEWKIVHKSTNWGGGFGSRWMGLNVPWGIYGIHGTNKPYSIGTNASHGCIRMFNKDVEKLYPIIPLGTPVSIVSESYPKYPPGFKKRLLKAGMSGPDVIEMQVKLKEAGIFWGRADGRFGNGTEIFVKRYQAFTGQELTGEFHQEDYDLLEELLAEIENNIPPEHSLNNNIN